MKSIFLKSVLMAVATLIAFGLHSGAARAETPAGSVVESRVVLGLAVNSEAMNALMPDGWVSISFPGGPLKGANAMVAFLDGHVVLDADGKPRSPATRTTATLLGLGKPPESRDVRMFVLEVYTDDVEANTYGSTHAATISRQRMLEGHSGTGRVHSERWTVSPNDGGEFSMSLGYTMGTPGWSTGTSKAFSAENTDFAVKQDYRQIADLAMSKALGKPLDGEISLESTVDGLANVLDGSEEIVAVINIPVYIRDVILP